MGCEDVARRRLETYGGRASRAARYLVSFGSMKEAPRCSEATRVPRSAFGARAWVSVVASAIAACSASAGSKYLHAKAVGDRAYSAGRFDEAARSYRQAELAATRPRDRDEAVYLQADAYRRDHRNADARALYDHLLAVSPEGERAPRAAFERVELDLEQKSPRIEQRLRSVRRCRPRLPQLGRRQARAHHLPEAVARGRRRSLGRWSLAPCRAHGAGRNTSIRAGVRPRATREDGRCARWLSRGGRASPLPAGLVVRRCALASVCPRREARRRPPRGVPPRAHAPNRGSPRP